MDLPILVDSSVYLRLMRQRLDPVAVLFEHYDTVNLVTCGMVQLEVLRAIKDTHVRGRLGAFMSLMHIVPTDERLWRSALSIAVHSSLNGIPVSEANALKAACALRKGASVLTLDSDFQRIPGLDSLSLPAHLDP
jgi:predicted nucleic acid-binding protein